MQTLRVAHLDEKQWPGVFASTIGLVFFSTPFRGSQTLHPTKLIEAASAQHESYEVQPEILQGLEPGTEYLKGLVGDFLATWRSQPRKPMILCLYEQMASQVNRIISQVPTKLVSTYVFMVATSIYFQRRE